MSTIKFRWSVDELANVMTIFNTQRVWRASLMVGPWTEITTFGTRVPLVAGVTDYYFDDTTGAAGYYYAVSYYHSGTLAESDKSVPVRVDSLGYVAIEDVRAEGFTAAMVSDAHVASGIRAATAYIERYTRRWFEPRVRSFRYDGKRGTDFFFDIPVIKLDTVTMWEEPLLLTELWVYNRHLTQGLLNPDDRDNPRIGWRDEIISLLRREFVGVRKFDAAHRNIVATGIFGFTELEPFDTPGETAPGSQIPLSYGVTPPLIKRACLLLTLRLMWPLASGRGDEFRRRNNVTSESTRDQSYSLAGPSTEDASWGISGDVEVDNILMQYAAPMACGVV